MNSPCLIHNNNNCNSNNNNPNGSVYTDMITDIEHASENQNKS